MVHNGGCCMGKKVVNLKISSHIEVDRFDINREIENQIKKELTLLNPAYKNAQRRNAWTGNIEKYKMLYEFNPKTGDIMLPRGYVLNLIDILNQHGLKYKVMNRTLTLKPVEFNHNIELWDYQKPAADALVNGIQGGIIGGCGCGKTQIMLNAIARSKQPALWITHTKDLLDQVIERYHLCFIDIKEDDIGYIAEGEVKIGKKFTVALVQTLKNIDIDSIKYRFGLVAVDEAHHIPADMFYSTLNKFPARRRIWCTATPKREDGLDDMLTIAGGNIVHVIDRSKLPTIIPKLKIVLTDFDYHGRGNYTDIIRKLVEDEARNRLIINVIKKEAPGNYNIVLGERIEHMEHLKNLLQKEMPSIRSGLLHGQLKKDIRNEVTKMAKEKQLDVLFATKLAREGLDMPHLNKLYLVAPKKASGAIEQEVGRIMRKYDGKSEAFVFDFWDYKSPILKSQLRKRWEVYASIGIDLNFKKCLYNRCA